MRKKKLKKRFGTVPLAQVLKKAVAEVRHNDHVERNTKKNVGADVEHGLPSAIANSARQSGAEGQMPRTVLVVDDEHVIADTLAVILRKCGYEVAVCYNAQSAIRQCACETPDLVISDVVMPGMNGVEMAVIIHERHPSCKILLFSGQATALDLLEEARQRGHNFELLSKPVHPKDLLSRISEGVDEGLVTRKFPPVGETYSRLRLPSDPPKRTADR